LVPLRTSVWFSVAYKCDFPLNRFKVPIIFLSAKLRRNSRN